LLKEKKNPLLYKKIESKPNKFRKSIPEQKKNHTMKIIRSFRPTISRKKSLKNFFCSPNQKKNQSNPFFSPLRSQNHMKKAQRHHDYLSSE